jgi:UrcA family protein
MTRLRIFGLQLLATAGALGVALLGSQAFAQGYYDGPPGYEAGVPPEEVYVFGHHRAPARSPETEAAIEDVVLQHPVRFDDLDLRTPWGARELEYRISYAAHRLCDQLGSEDSPITNSNFIPADNAPCYGPAMDDAMHQADIAIARARRGY